MKKTSQKISSQKRITIFTKKILSGTGVAALAYICFFALTLNIMAHETFAFDYNLSRFIYSYRTPLLTQLMFFTTFLGGNVMLLISSVGVFFFLIWKKYRHEAFFFLTTFAFGVCFNLVLKFILARARPDIAPLIHEVFFSYPSGHSMNSFVFYALLAYLLYHFSRNVILGVISVIICTVIIASIGISRIYLGVHYPSDVIGGYLAGCGWFLTVMVIDRIFRTYALSKKQSSRSNT